MRREQLVAMLVAEEHRLTHALGPVRKELRHHIAGGMLNSIPAPVDPVGNAPSSSLNTVAHLDPLPERARDLEMGSERD